MAAAVPFVVMAIAAYASMERSRNEAAALREQGQIGDMNAEISRRSAQDALNVSTANQMKQRREAAQVLGRQRAAVAQSGTGFGGSNADLLERSETLVELDQLNIAYEGELKSRGYTSQAEIDAFQANAYRRQATRVRRSSTLQAFGAGAGAYGMTSGFGR